MVPQRRRRGPGSPRNESGLSVSEQPARFGSGLAARVRVRVSREISGLSTASTVGHRARFQHYQSQGEIGVNTFAVLTHEPRKPMRPPWIRLQNRACTI